MQYYVYIIPILICIYLFLGKRLGVISCLSVVSTAANKLLPNLAVSKNMHLLFHHFYESRVQAHLGWDLCFSLLQSYNHVINQD